MLIWWNRKNGGSTTHNSDIFHMWLGPIQQRDSNAIEACMARLPVAPCLPKTGAHITRHTMVYMGLLPDTRNWGLCICRECRERFPSHPRQSKPLVNDPGMHHGTCVTNVPWCMSGSLTCSGGENVPGIPGACATRNFTYLVRGPCSALVTLCAAAHTIITLETSHIGHACHLPLPAESVPMLTASVQNH